jgi:hypothetical protein
MRTRQNFRTFAGGTSARSVGLLLAVVALGVGYAALAFAQGNAPAQLPNGPAKPGFDIARFSPNGGIFKTFDVEQTEPLRKVLQEGRVAEDTPVLVTATAAGNLALLSIASCTTSPTSACTMGSSSCRTQKPKHCGTT